MASDTKWLFMLYLSGDNNLSSEMIWALKDIEDQGLPDGFDMTILYDALSPFSPTFVYDLSGQSENGPGGAVETDPAVIAPLPLPRMKDAKPKLYEWVEDSSNPETLRKFIEWSVFGRSRASIHRMLILSGHGSGAVGDFLPDNHSENGQHGSLTIRALEKALNDAQSHWRDGSPTAAKLLNVLGMDSCLMSMAEVCYEVRDSVEYLVGSEGFVQDAGWPYGFLLKKLREQLSERIDGNYKAIPPAEMVESIVQNYIAYYREYLPANVSVDMSGCELAKLGQPNEADGSRTLMGTVSRLTSLLISELRRSRPEASGGVADPLVRDLVILAHWRAQSYKFEQYTDLWDFCEELRKLKALSPQRLESISSAAKQVQDAIDAVVGRETNGDSRQGKGRQDYEGIEFQHSHGLSVYFPWSSGAFVEDDQNEYRKLAFGADSGWGEFLVEYLDTTKRELRMDDNYPSTQLPIFGLESNDAKRKQTALQADHRNAPNSGRNAPNSGRNAPNSGRNAPNSGRMLELFLESLSGSMKNPPQSVYLRPATVAPSYLGPRDPHSAVPLSVRGDPVST